MENIKLPAGYEIILQDEGKGLVLCHTLNDNVPEPFVVWSLDGRGGVCNGSYSSNIKEAFKGFDERRESHA